jgi:hypothetical protein
MDRPFERGETPADTLLYSWPPSGPQRPISGTEPAR